MDKSDESIRKEQTSIYPWTLSPQKSFLNPTPKGTFTHRPLFKCQGQLKIKFIFPLNNISKEINAILTFGITSPLLKWKKIPPYLSQSQGSQLSPNARINLVGKLCSTVIFWTLFFFKYTELIVNRSMKKWKVSRVVDNIIRTLQKSLNNKKPSSE